MYLTQKEQREFRAFCLRRVTLLTAKYKLDYSAEEIKIMFDDCETIIEPVVELLRMEKEHIVSLRGQDYFTKPESGAFQTFVKRRCRAYATIPEAQNMAEYYEKELHRLPLHYVLLDIITAEADILDEEPWFVDALKDALRKLPQ